METGRYPVVIQFIGYFNPLHREGGDPLNKVWVNLHIISIHSTARVETQGLMAKTETETLFQSTPPRGWRPIRKNVEKPLPIISIHSTARVETAISVYSLYPFGISIHSTARVETLQAIPVFLAPV